MISSTVEAQYQFVLGQLLENCEIMIIFLLTIDTFDKLDPDADEKSHIIQSVTFC